MKTKHNFPLGKTCLASFSTGFGWLNFLTILFLMSAAAIQAQVATKTGSVTDLTGATAGAWSGGAGVNGSPAATDVATWNGSSLGAGSTLGTSSSWGGISVASALTDIAINGAGTLTLGASNVDLSASTVNMSIGTPVALGASQTWKVTSGKTLTVSGVISGAATTNLTLSGGGTNVLSALNSYAGITTVSNGATLTANTAADGNCSLGAAYNVANSLTFGAGGGTLNFTGTGQSTRPVTFTGPGIFNVAAGASLTLGTLNSTPTTTLGAWSGSGGITNAGAGTLIVSNNSTGGTYRFGVDSSRGGVFTMQAGKFLINSSYYFVIGDSTSGTFNQTGGSTIFADTVGVAGPDVFIGNKTGTGMLSVSGGTFTATNATAGNPTSIRVGSGNTATTSGGTLTIGGGSALATVDALQVTLCAANNGYGILNLSSNGLLKANGIGKGTAGTTTLNFDGGTLRAKTNNAAFIVSGFGTAAITTNGLTIDNNSFSITNAQALSGAGSLTSTGSGYLALSAANTYASNTIINGGTLALTASGSIAASSTVNIAAGATFDVSAYPTYTWGTSAILTATGTNSSSATLKGGTTVDLSSRSATLNYNPATVLGDSSHPALTVSAGTLNLAGTTIAVNNYGSPLGAGDYTLISGAVSGTPATFSGTVGVNGLAAHCSATLNATSGTKLVLHVVSTLPSSTTTIALKSPWVSPSTYGDALVFHVVVTGGSPAPHGGAVTVYDGGVGGTVIGTGTLPGSGGTVDITLSPLNGLSATTHASIVATYGGDSDNSSSVSAPMTSQVVQPKTLTFSGATANSKAYDGTTTATVTSGTLSGVVSGDTIYATNANFASAGPGAALGVTVALSGVGTTNYSFTSPSLSADILSAATWTDVSGGGWDTAGNWLENVIGNGSGVTADFSTLDITADATVSLNSPRTIGNLVFGDTNTNTPAGWTLNNGGASTNVLTLAGTSPTVTVNALGGSKNVTISTVIAGIAGLTKAGNGTLVVSGTNTYSGVTTINGGTVSASTAADGNCSLGSAYNIANALTFGTNGGTLNFTGTNQSTRRPVNFAGAGIFNVAAGADLTLGTTNGQPTATEGTWTGTGGVTKSGAGTLYIRNTATAGYLPSRFTVDTNNGGDFTMQAGNLVINPNYYFVIGDSAPGNFYQTGGYTTFADTVGVSNPDVYIGNKAGNGTLTISGGTFTATNVTAGNPTSIRVCSGNTGTATGVLTIGGGTGPAFMDALQVKLCPNTDGSATLNLLTNGVLKTIGLSKTAGTVTLNFDGGTLRARTNNAAFMPSGFDTVGVTANGLTIDNNGYSISIGQALSGIGGLTSVGNGTLELTADNTGLTGITTVSNGTLLVDNPSGLGTGTGSVTVNSGTLGGTGIIGGATTVNATAVLAAGVNGVGTLTFNGNLILNSTSTNNFVVTTAGGVSNQVAVAGTLAPNSSVVSITSGTSLAVGSYTLFTYGSTNGTTFNATPVFDVAPAGSASIVDTGSGQINLVIASGPTGPASITNSITGFTLTLTWPAGQGWRLVSQTNSLATGLNPSSAAWSTVPGVSDGNASITVDPTKPTVFYRLVYP